MNLAAIASLLLIGGIFLHWIVSHYRQDVLVYSYIGSAPVVHQFAEMIYRPTDLPKDFESLVRLYPPRAIRNKLVLEKTMEMVDALTLVPDLSSGQLAYLDTRSVLVEYYEAGKDCWAKAKK